MKVLELDVDSITYELVKPEAKIYEESDEKKVTVKDAIVMLVSVEEGDDKATAEKAASEVLEFATRVGRKTIVVYPFAHLSNSLADPKTAQALINAIYQNCKANGLESTKAPFGWNKKLSLLIKGHPLAEQGKSYPGSGTDAKKSGPKGIKEEVVSAALKEEEKVKSSWYILDTKGNLIEVDKFDFSKHKNLKKFADYEIKKVRAYPGVPEHIKLMHKLKLVDYEPGSDAGNMRYYPKGRLIKSLLERYVTERTVNYGAVEVETPIMYDYQHPALKSYLERFPSRHYIVTSDDKEFFLRFAACFGQFLIMHDATISYKQLPLGVYELARYSFRREKSGEVTGLKRLRAFTMPDMHTICKDINQAKMEFEKQFVLCQSVLDDIGIRESEYEAAIRFTEEFWSSNKEFVKDIVKNKLKKPALIETWNFRYAYFDPKFEFNVIDSMDKATALSTVQIDHENSERYDVKYVDDKGEKKHSIILHCSPSGAIERDIYALLELSALRVKKGEAASLPLWLAPTQIRLLPISDKHVEYCLGLAKELKGNQIRADIDDTNETLDKKIRNAEQEWVPYIVVIGDKEVSTSELSVRIREGKKQEKISLGDLMNLINSKTAKMPKDNLSLNLLLSKRPIFSG